MSALHTPIQDLKIGDKVIFWPSLKSLEWAAGIRTVAGFEGEYVRLSYILIGSNNREQSLKEELQKTLFVAKQVDGQDDTPDSFVIEYRDWETDRKSVV